MPFFTDRKPSAGLRSAIGRDYNIEPEDVRGAKSALAQLGDADRTLGGAAAGRSMRDRQGGAGLRQSRPR